MTAPNLIPLAEAERQEAEAQRQVPARWPAPDTSITSEGRRPAVPLPLEVFGSTWARWITDTAEGCSAPIDYVAGALLAVASTAIGNSRRVSPWDGWAEPSILWIALVGAPSSGKSPATDPVLNLLKGVEFERSGKYADTLRQFETDKAAAKEARAIWEAEVKQAVKEQSTPPEMPASAVEPVCPPMPRLVLNDATPEAAALLLAGNPRGVLYHRDELSGWLGSFGRYSGSEGERAFWIEAFGGRPYVVDRMKRGEPIRVSALSLSVLGGIQPDRLASILLGGDDDGLAARFLYFWPEPIPPKRPQRIGDNVMAEAAIRRLLNLDGDVGEQGLVAKVIRFSARAADLFSEWRQENAVGEGRGMLGSHLGKLPGLICRLALVLEHLAWATTPGAAEPIEVSEVAALRAVVFVSEYIIPMADRVFGDAALPAVQRHAATLARRIRSERVGIINARHVRRAAWAGTRDQKEIVAAIHELIGAGWLRETRNRVGSHPGRARADYEVNPQIGSGTR